MLRLFVFALALVVAAPAFAHTRSQSSSHWRVEGDLVKGRVEAEALDVTRLYAPGGEAPMAEQFRRHVAGAFDIVVAEEACVAEGEARIAPASSGRVAAEAAFRCKAGALSGGVVSLTSRLFVDVAPSHLHFTSVSDGQGGEAEAVLTDARRTSELRLQREARAESAWAALLRFIPIGAEHVWGGLGFKSFALGYVNPLLSDRSFWIDRMPGITWDSSAVAGRDPVSAAVLAAPPPRKDHCMG